MEEKLKDFVTLNKSLENDLNEKLNSIDELNQELDRLRLHIQDKQSQFKGWISFCNFKDF